MAIALTIEQAWIDAERHRQAGDLGAAERAYRSLLDQDPGLTDVWITLGNLLRRTRRPAEAERCHRAALNLEPQNELALLNLGNALFDQQRTAEAAQAYRQTLQRNPRCAEAHNNLGRAVLRADPAGALNNFVAALQLRSDYFEAAEGAGLALYGEARWEEAQLAFRRALQLRPDAVVSRVMLGRALLANGQIEDAAQVFEELERDSPGQPAALAGSAAVLARRGADEQALEKFAASLAADPRDDWARFEQSVLRLARGEYGEAWSDYDRSRLNRRVEAERRRDITSPQWSGEPLAGKTLLVTAEQGVGDEIMFASILPELIAAAGECIIECDARLATLYNRSFPEAIILGVDRTPAASSWWHKALPAALPRLPPADFWSPIGSLPRYRRADAAAFPKHSGYLVPDPDRVRHWQNVLAEPGAGLRVGVSWRGGTNTTNRSARSLELRQLAPLLGLAGVQFISLQHGDCAAELQQFTAESGTVIRSWPGITDDFDEYAALIASLDVVVTVCSAVVHLAGALEKPAWVLTPAAPEWRYGRSGESMIWYPSVRLFRQTPGTNWEAVIAEVAGRVAGFRP